MRLLLAGLIVALLGAIVWFGVEPMDERTQLLLTNNRGTITEGERLGVSVGDSWSEANASIRQRFDVSYSLWSDERDGFTHVSDAPVLAGRAEVHYRDRSWRNGVIVLEVVDGVVAAVHWNYSGPLYIDL